MIVRDMFGNILSEKDPVAFALTAGNLSVGQIEKISTGLDGSAPYASVTINVTVPIAPNGLLPGVVHIKVEEEKRIV